MDGKNHKAKVRASTGAWCVATAIILLVGGWQTYRLGEDTDSHLREDLLRDATSIADTITSTQVQSLTFSLEDRDRADFKRLRNQLIAVTEHLSVSWVYTIAQRNGAFVFGPESYPEGHPNASPPGTVYRQPPPELAAVFQQCHAKSTQPYLDEYGSFVSVFVPVLDPRSGKVLIALGIDVPSDLWKSEIRKAKRVPLCVSLIFLAILFASRLVLEYRHRLPPLMRWHTHYAEAFLTLIVMLTLSLAATWYIHSTEARIRQNTFTSLAYAKATGISMTMREVEERLESLNRFFLASGYVDAEEFRLFVDQFYQDGLSQIFTWLPDVPKSRLQGFTEEMRRSGMPDFSVWQLDDRCERMPAGDRPTYHPVLYVMPTNDQALVGFDMGSERVRRKTIDQALRDRLCTASEPISFFTHTDQPSGILVLQPVNTQRQRGIVSAALHLNNLIRTPANRVEDMSNSLITDLFLLRKNEPPVYLASSRHSHTTHIPGEWRVREDDRLQLLVPIFCFGQTYALRVQASPDWIAQHPVRAGQIALCAGLLLTALLTTLIAFLSNRRLALEREVQSRTSDLQQIHDNVRSLLNAAPVAMLVVDTCANVVDANHTAEILFARQLSSLKTRRIGDLIGCVQAGKEQDTCGQSPACGACALNTALQNVINGQPSVHDQDLPVTLNRNGKDQTLWLRFSVEPVQFNNARHAMAALFDVSAWYRAEEALLRERNLLYALMDNLPDRIYFKDKDSRFIKISKAHAESLGLKNADDAIGKTDADFKTEAIANHTRNEEQELLLSGEPLLGHVEHKTGLDGKIRWVSASKAPIKDKEGHIVGLVGISRDITQEIELQQQLQQASKLDAMGRLAGGVAHDFNNLLQAILGFTEILLSGQSERSPQYSDLKQIERAASRAADLTHQLLAFSRKQRIEPQLIDLNQTISSTEKMLCRLMGEEIHIELSLDANILPILADPNQIEQIVMNLAVNARDAMPKGGRLTFSTRDMTITSIDPDTAPEARPGRFSCLIVHDTGAGINPKMLPHLFEPFFTTKAQGKGTGLGLSVIYGIVKQNSGWIDVSSKEEHGTTFTIYFPAQNKPARKSDAVKPKIEAISLPGLGKNILLVEDEAGVRSLVTLVLESAGYRVSACDNAKTAMDIFDRDPARFDLLFSDIVLGGKNGIDLACELRVKRPDLRVLLCSGYADDRVPWKSIEREEFSFLAKPFPATTLMTAINKMFIKRPSSEVSGKEIL